MRTKEGANALRNALGAGFQNRSFLTPRFEYWHLQAVVDLIWNREGPLIQHCAQHFHS
jgi:hypothetical protein